MGYVSKYLRKDCNGEVGYFSDTNVQSYPVNWPEVYAWLGKLDFLVNGKIPAYAGRCTSTAKQRMSGVAYNGSSCRELRPISGLDVELVDNKVCDILEHEHLPDRRGYLRPSPSVKYQEQAAINTIKKVQSIFPDNFLVLNWADGCSQKPLAKARFEKWTEEHNDGYDYYPSWFEKIVRIVAGRIIKC
tara:strand:- start:217 stop:780 length:564 start_codon:yes stop_codon:yes gene_type:complete